MEEIWKPIKNYNGYYSISNKGRIRRDKDFKKIKKGGYLKPAKNTCGYFHVQLYKNGIKKDFRIHRLVGEHFIGILEKGLYTNHIDGIKTNNHVSNLEYVTASYNIRHAILNGLREKQKEWVIKIPLIRKEFNKGNISQYKLSKKYGICWQSINRIVRNIRYAHIV